MKNLIYFSIFCLSVISYAQSGRTNPNLKNPSSTNTPTNNPSVEKELTEEEKQKIIDDLNNGRQQRTTTSPSTNDTNPQETSNSQNKWVFGGNFALSFGRFTTIAVVPRVGYQFSPNLIGGLDFGYTYTSVENTNKTNLFNGGIFIQPIFQDFFGIANYMYYNGNQKYNNSNLASVNINEHVLWLGGGYRARIGGNAFTTIGIQYNVLHNDRSIFGQAWQPMAGVQMGF